MEILKAKKTLREGFTLIEILLYIGIAAVMATAVSFFMHLILQSRIENQAAAEVEQQGIQIMQVITQTVRNSSSIGSPLPGAGAASLSLIMD